MKESLLVDRLIRNGVNFPHKKGGQIRYVKEVKVTANRVDVVCFETKNNSSIKYITAIEAKLHDWKKAIQQAYGDKLFAHRVYVALPKEFSTAAINNISEFRNASVGLIIADDNSSKVYFNPPINNCRSSFHFDKVCESLRPHLN